MRIRIWRCRYPASKLSVHVLDDGAREEVKAMCHKIEFQRRWLARKGAGKEQPPVFYTTRTKASIVTMVNFRSRFRFRFRYRLRSVISIIFVIQSPIAALQNNTRGKRG